jgi:phosphohistidine swiveling domain-containing protein
VFVIQSRTAAESFPEGAVLVSRTTDPTMVRAMLKATALVTEIGGPMCHTAIVAIELGIPCVVAVPGVLSNLTDGMLVEVDGGRGCVSVIDR